MFVKGFRQKAEDYRMRASYAQTAIDRDWAAYCAGILEEQAAHFERTGRCHDHITNRDPSTRCRQ
jgi:hypothetical protein